MRWNVIVLTTLVMAQCLVASLCLSAMPDKESRVFDADSREGDNTITNAVKVKLASAPGANLTAIDINTERRTVYLTGTVDSAEQKLQADELVRQVDGVARVVNRLRIQGESQPETTGTSGTESQVPTDSGRRSAK